MPRPQFHDLTIQSVTAQTDKSVMLTFDVPDKVADDFAFVPGQYLTLRARIDGQDVRRAYSICSALDDKGISVGIKQVDDGIFSNYVMGLQSGDTLSVMPPQGRFTAPIGGSHNYLLLAAGSGITPVLSICRSVLAAEENSHVTLCYANRDITSIMFRDMIDDLKDRFMTRFSLVHLLTGEMQDIELFNGRLDAEKIDTMVTKGLIHPDLCDAIYICGPEHMTRDLIVKLQELGIDEARIKYELFTPAPSAAPKPETLKADRKQDDDDKMKVTVIIDGSSRILYMAEDDNLLDVAAKAGLDLPYSCANGMCATCRCRIADGEADMRQNFSLEPWELEAGYLLSCQFHPKSKAVTLDFDAS